MSAVFAPAERSRLRERLVQAAREDESVTSASLVGSVARGEEDRWSDIDLVLGIDGGTDPGVVAQRWTAAMYADHGAVHHLDVVAGGILYRVFLLASSLQVDVSFWPQDEVRATEPGFLVQFGTVGRPEPPREHDPRVDIGWAWLYALHARSALARGRTWQAVSMLDLLRDAVVVLACARHGLPRHHGKGADRLPTELRGALAATHARTLDDDELARRFAGLLGLLMAEVRHADAELAERIGPAVALLTEG